MMIRTKIAVANMVILSHIALATTNALTNIAGITVTVNIPLFLFVMPRFLLKSLMGCPTCLCLVSQNRNLLLPREKQ